MLIHEVGGVLFWVRCCFMKQVFNEGNFLWRVKIKGVVRVFVSGEVFVRALGVGPLIPIKQRWPSSHPRTKGTACRPHVKSPRKSKWGDTREKQEAWIFLAYEVQWGEGWLQEGWIQAGVGGSECLPGGRRQSCSGKAWEVTHGHAEEVSPYDSLAWPILQGSTEVGSGTWPWTLSPSPLLNPLPLNVWYPCCWRLHNWQPKVELLPSWALKQRCWAADPSPASSTCC